MLIHNELCTTPEIWEYCKGLRPTFDAASTGTYMNTFTHMPMLGTGVEVQVCAALQVRRPTGPTAGSLLGDLSKG